VTRSAGSPGTTSAGLRTSWPSSSATRGWTTPERLGSQLLLLIVGASSPMVVEGDSEMALEIAEQARRVAAVVLDAATSRLTVPVAGGSQ